MPTIRSATLAVVVCMLTTVALPVAAQNTRIDACEAKKRTPQSYTDRQEEFYCGCRYSRAGAISSSHSHVRYPQTTVRLLLRLTDMNPYTGV